MPTPPSRTSVVRFGARPRRDRRGAAGATPKRKRKRPRKPPGADVDASLQQCAGQRGSERPPVAGGSPCRTGENGGNGLGELGGANLTGDIAVVTLTPASLTG